MDAGLVCKCICADNRLGRSIRNAGNGLNHAAGTVNLLGVNAGIAVKVILAGLECHDNFFQRSIAGALADAIDGTLYLTDACLNAAPLPNSQLGQNLATPGWNCHHDNFKDSNPNIEWKATLEQAEKVGMGTRAYTLKKV